MDKEVWPSIPSELKYLEFRVPGTFRELVASKEFSHEEIGRIVRCLVMDTDIFVTPKIEPEVFFYRKNLVKRNRTRARVAALRMKQNTYKEGAVAASEKAAREASCSVTVTQGDSKIRAGGADSSSQSTPINPLEKISPIVPLEESTPSSLVTGAVEDVNKDVNDVDSRLTRPEEALAKHLKKRRKLMPSETAQDDLFAAMGRQEPRETPKSTPQGVQDASEGSGGTLIPLGTGSDSRAVMARNPLPSAKDPRDDNAWIPQRFDIFWAKYPRKVAKADAKKAFSKLIKAQEDVDVFMKTLLASVDWWKTQDSWIQDRGKYIPYPATWLNAGHWEDARTQGGQAQGSAQFLAGDVETDDDLIRRMTGG